MINEIYNVSLPLNKIISPLVTHLKITGFTYKKKYRDNSFILLTLDPSWENYLLKERGKKYNDYYSINKMQWNNLSPKFVIWDHMKRDTDKEHIYHEVGELHFNRWHGMTLYFNRGEYIESFSFCTSKDNESINHYYECKKKIFYKFSFYFLEKARDLIKNAEKNKIFINLNYENVPKLTVEEDVSDKLLDKLSVKKAYVFYNKKLIYFTRREIDCIKWLINGKSCFEISLILNVKESTIQTHIQTIKEKLGLFKTNQVVRFFIENQFNYCL